MRTTKELVDSVLSWWEKHQEDQILTATEKYRLYEKEPEFVTMARELGKKQAVAALDREWKVKQCDEVSFRVEYAIGPGGKPGSFDFGPVAEEAEALEIRGHTGDCIFRLGLDTSHKPIWGPIWWWNVNMQEWVKNENAVDTSDLVWNMYAVGPEPRKYTRGAYTSEEEALMIPGHGAEFLFKFTNQPGSVPKPIWGWDGGKWIKTKESPVECVECNASTGQVCYKCSGPICDDCAYYDDKARALCIACGSDEEDQDERDRFDCLGFGQH